jgi:hypothetical protein
MVLEQCHCLEFRIEAGAVTDREIDAVAGEASGIIFNTLVNLDLGLKLREGREPFHEPALGQRRQHTPQGWIAAARSSGGR